MKNILHIVDATDAVATSRAFATALLMMAADLPDDCANPFQAVTGSLLESLQKAADSLEAVLPKIGERN